MARSVKALINPELLEWARSTAHMSLAEAAKKAKVTEEKLAAWEAGKDAPTVAKLRLLAKAYRRPLSVFYLPERPLDFAPLKDFRRLPGEVAGFLSPRLAAEIRMAHERRQFALELYEELGEEAPRLQMQARVTDDPEEIGGELRRLLGVTLDEQREWADPRVAYNGWREKIEALGVLVFQLSRIPVSEVRGFAIANDGVVPVVAVNAKDSYTARSFSLVHEFAHLVLGESSISDFDESTGQAPRFEGVDRIEVFCNAVAAATLLPREEFLREPLVAAHEVGAWSDEDLETLARAYGVSPHAVLRRLLTVGKTSREFYQRKLRQYEEEAAQLAARKAKGGPAPHVAALANLGGGYARLVFEGYYNRRLTLADVSGQLNLKVSHIPRLEAAAFGRAA
ncbi:MAG: ImmA/IrrE family metallo-endopeptidase [Hyphomicrobiaceae bacterium]|nr:ImmA/IrrE family metallo-endopeptidase [Hyphomicrobiaceae bacterium]